MSKAVIEPGSCGLVTVVEASMNSSGKVSLHIESACKSIRSLAEDVTEVDPYGEISFRRGMPQILEAGVKHCTHAACPVPVGIIKAVEIAAGLNLPSDVSIKLSKD